MLEILNLIKPVIRRRLFWGSTEHKINVAKSGKTQNIAYSIKIEILLYLASIMSKLHVCYISMNIYNSTISELRTALCNAAISIASIEGDKLACAYSK